MYNKMINCDFSIILVQKIPFYAPKVLVLYIQVIQYRFEYVYLLNYKYTDIHRCHSYIQCIRCYVTFEYLPVCSYMTI